MTDVSTLDVLLHGVPIGTLTSLGADRSLFAFADSYIADEARPTLGLGFKDDVGELSTEFRPTRIQLLPFFANLLPEGRMREYLARKANVDPEREFFLIRELGMDLPGAITVLPAGEEVWPRDDGDDSHDAADGGDGHDTTLRFSLAGVQLKFSAIGEARGGLTVPANGVGGSWILKLPSPAFPGLPEAEFSMMELAREVGMDVPEVRLVALEDVGNLPEGLGRIEGDALAVRRCDRGDNGQRIHSEDFAQVFSVYPADKYKRASYRVIAGVLARETGDESAREFVRRLTFSMLIGNADMHLKNWSLIYRDRRNAELAPAYDFVPTVAWIPDTGAALKVSRTKRFDHFDDDELSHLAAKATLSRRLVLDTARETVELFRQAWREQRHQLPMSQEVVAAVERHLATVPIASGS